MAVRIKVLRDNKTGEVFYPITSVDTVFNPSGQSVQQLFDLDADRFEVIETDIEDLLNRPGTNITSSLITYWNNKSDFSGNYNDLTNKPTISGNSGDIVLISSSGNWIVSSGTTINDIKGKAKVTHNETDHTIIGDDNSFVSVYSSSDLQNLIISEDAVVPSTEEDIQVQAIYRVIDKSEETTTDSYELAPNYKYLFGERETLTITLGHIEDDTIVNEYLFEFNSGSTATTLNVPTTIKWLKDPDIQTNKTYVVSIENNLGIIGEWSNE